MNISNSSVGKFRTNPKNTGLVNRDSMVRDWLHKRKDIITPYASSLRQAALLVLSKIAKNLFSFFPFFILPFMFLTLALVNNSYEYFELKRW